MPGIIDSGGNRVILRGPLRGEDTEKKFLSAEFYSLNYIKSWGFMAAGAMLGIIP